MFTILYTVTNLFTGEDHVRIIAETPYLWYANSRLQMCADKLIGQGKWIPCIDHRSPFRMSIHSHTGIESLSISTTIQ